MSTKTTFKRIALVAVASMGFGVLSAIPGTAAGETNTNYPTTGLSLNASSITVVDASGSNAGYGVFEVATTDGSTSTTGAGTDDLDGSESIVAQVTAWPTGLDSTTAASDLELAWAASGDTWNFVTGALNTAVSAGVKTANSSSLEADAGLTASLRGGDSTDVVPTYLLKVGTASGKAIGKGTYTIRLRLLDAVSNVIATQNLSFTVVADKADSGAVVTVGSGGLLRAGGAVGTSDTEYLKATLTDANGGLIREGANGIPAITPTLFDTAAVPAALGSSFTASDSGDANDFNTSTVPAIALDGVYGVAATVGTYTTATSTWRVRYGAANASATVTVAGATTAVTGTADVTSAPSVSAAGLTATSAAPTWYIPTTTKTASLSVFTGTGSATLTNYPVTFTVTWTNGAAGDVTPKAATPTVVYSDASGYATLNITNNTPVNGAIASVAISGFSSAGQPTTQTINWVSPGRQTTISVSPSSQRVATGTSTVVTATVTDRFGSPVAGVVLQPSVSSTSASYTTTPMATVTTDATGKATVTLTAGANLTSDALTFTDVAGLATVGTATYSYRTTVDTIASFLNTYDLNESTALASISTPVPSTGITQSSGAYLSITKARDNSRAISLTTSTSNDMIIIRAQALTSASAGAVSRPVVVTGSEGVWSRSSATGTAAASRTLVTDANGFISVVVGSNKTGANTVTLTAGTVSTTVAFWTANEAADARYVTLTGAATAVANADAIPFTATVTDRYGNPVSGVTLTIQASGVAVMGGGSTLQTFQTNSTGTFTFTGTSLNAAGGTGTFTASAPSTAEFASAAGISGAASIDSTVTAGRSSSAVVVTFAAGENAAAANAQAASDAAAEATDAANAATDAANAAAEAADAATAAAQDAADAVAALSTQVSEMVNALKKQITALTNLVIKIQKKVKA
jgi:hypothetical protein